MIYFSLTIKFETWSSNGWELKAVTTKNLSSISADSSLLKSRISIAASHDELVWVDAKTSNNCGLQWQRIQFNFSIYSIYSIHIYYSKTRYVNMVTIPGGANEIQRMWIL